MEKKISATLVNGFLEAGKTTWIQDCFRNDFFYRRGRTLLLLFEEGETEYDRALLDGRNTIPVVCCSDENAAEFISRNIARYTPDRVYIEMNAMRDDLYEAASSLLRIDYSVTLIDGSTLPLYMSNLRQQLQRMITTSNQVIFRSCPLESLAPYANIFRVMNNKASYLWEAPSGYHEKAFGIMVPYDMNKKHISLSESDFVPFCLDAMASPHNYEGKTVTLTCTARREGGIVKAGRQVMTCCAADIQFLGFPCVGIEENAWVTLTAECIVKEDMYRRKYLTLEPISISSAKMPAKPIINGLTGNSAPEE